MEFHLDHKIRFTTQIEFDSLYKWALQEIGADGKIIGRDQIPWSGRLYFLVTDMSVAQRIEIPHLSDGTPRCSETITAELKPEDWNQTAAPTFSMLGTNRIIKNFSLSIERGNTNDAHNVGTAWGIVSYTSEVDFQHVKEPDILGFRLVLPPEHYDLVRQAALREGGDCSVTFNVSRVNGFYAEWSPGITARQIKVLTAYRDQVVALPDNLKDVPRLGSVGEFALGITRRNALERRHRLDVNEVAADNETESVGTIDSIHPRDEDRSRHAQLLREIKALQRAIGMLIWPLWLLVVVALAVVIFRS